MMTIDDDHTSFYIYLYINLYSAPSR